VTGVALTVTLKLATSLDGRIALADGRSKWITGPQSRAAVHALRAAHDCVLTGVGTILADDPKMTARPGGDPSSDQPLRAVMDTHARTPADSAFLAAGPAVVFHSSNAPSALTLAQARLVALPKDDAGQLSFDAALDWLAENGCRSVMIEAGGQLAASAIGSGRVTSIEWFRAPVLLGGDGLACIAALGLESLENPPTFTVTKRRSCGRDVWESWERT
jgi:diaminohydroxyphosphoribosylaminopyrimidine deaminase/5-amino-6-(5-phosphoribosylamino)uracil reductase